MESPASSSYEADNDVDKDNTPRWWRESDSNYKDEPTFKLKYLHSNSKFIV